MFFFVPRRIFQIIELHLPLFSFTKLHYKRICRVWSNLTTFDSTEFNMIPVHFDLNLCARFDMLLICHIWAFYLSNEYFWFIFLHVNTFCVLWVFHLRFFSAQFAQLSCTLEEVMDTQPWTWKSCMKLHLGPQVGAFFSAYISEF